MAKPNSTAALPEPVRAELTQLWAKAATVKPVHPDATTAQALAFGRNFRLDLAAAFEAALKTAQAVIQGVAAVHAPFDVMAWFEVSVETITAIKSIFAALVEHMRPIDYVTSVVLASQPQGMTADELRRAVEAFLNDPRVGGYTWYLSMNAETVRRAKEVLAMPNWFEKALENLQEAEFLDRSGDRLVFRSRNFTFGWKMG